MAVRVSETETKYEAPSGTALPLLAGLLEDLPEVTGTTGPEDQHLDAEYYDTGDLRLLRVGITLRRRTGGDDAGWHLKLPAGPQTRQEVRLPGGSPAVPAELAALVLVHTRGRPLRPVARIVTTRRRLILLGGGGRSLAEVAADEVRAQTMGGTTTVSQWHELEVELTGGDRRLLTAVDGVLRGDGLRPAAHAAKLERALDREPAGPASEPELTPATPAGQVVLAYLRAQAGRLTALDPLVREDEPDSVHQMRVTTRRLRGTLRSFRRVLPRAATGQLSAELKWLGGLLGEARDREVLPAHLLAATRDIPVQNLVGPVRARIQAHFAPMGAAARAEVLDALGSARYFALLDELDRLLAAPPDGPDAGRPAAAVLPAAVHRTYRRAARRMRRAWRLPPGRRQDAALHEARKAARQARYAAEAVVPVAGRPARRFARQMKHVQSVLGDHQDAVLAGEVARQLGVSAHLAGENAFSYGLISERESGSRARLRARARKVWRKASRRKYRRWTM
ncbi:MAG TPA: CYTH and CHAD domain-containing protein [Streptosporangiaceae bacterium]|jgi:CHAD domain-containing protein